MKSHVRLTEKLRGQNDTLVLIHETYLTSGKLALDDMLILSWHLCLHIFFQSSENKWPNYSVQSLNYIIVSACGSFNHICHWIREPI